ncbi:hypothetical protein LK542_10925 [Massilia sp. IC2-477]|uniref:hypothetical protein n=1 Tax=Massilia sp. IC2-477 TaxID=2887198 RepID=UPI001D12DEDF|nr:hypothetical protein [Massilia sp. IC2-477]MCC2956128.1 hypothetical protein [Massilia sp. IC2-477]
MSASSSPNVSRFPYRLPGIALSILLAADAVAADERHGLRAVRNAGPAPAIDGRLDDAAWQRAPAYDGFHKHAPRDGKEAAGGLRTTVQLLVDDQALVFGIRAWDDAPDRMRGALARRDKVDLDQDFIGIWIDPVGHGRAAQFVRVNLAGVVSDGLHRADDDESDLGPDFPVEAAVTRLPDGYSMEVRWPLSNLRFPYRGGKDWRLLVERSVPHADGTLLVSAPLRLDALSHLSFLRDVEGMDDTVAAVRDRRFLELRPELTLRAERGAHEGLPRRGHQAELGLEINARPRADWVFNATINPDYSQVEVDQPVSQGAGNIALSLPEKRGFFLESADVLGLPLPAFYSRTVGNPAWGLRATWRAADADATAMSLRDQEGGLVLRGRPYETLEYIQPRPTRASLWRGRWHGDGLLLGAFASQRAVEDLGSNDVIGMDAQWRGDTFGGAQGQAVVTAMHARATSGFDEDGRPLRRGRQSGGYLHGKYIHSSDDWWNEFALEAIAPGFVNDNGFVPQAGIVKGTAEIARKRGQQSFAGLELYEFETLLQLAEVRTLHDRASGQPGGEVVTRELRPGIWMMAPRQTEFWTLLGFDRQRARPRGRLHDTRALHLGFASTPLPWVSKIAGEIALGRQLDADADRVGPGGNVTLDVGLRFPLRRGWSLELDHHFNRAWVQGTLGHPAFADNAWRWLANLHFSPRDSLRLLAQNTWAARRDDGVTRLEAWNERQVHRSLLYRYQWRHGRIASAGYVDEKMPLVGTRSKSLTFKLQWEL